MAKANDGAQPHIPSRTCKDMGNCGRDFPEIWDSPLFSAANSGRLKVLRLVVSRSSRSSPSQTLASPFSPSTVLTRASLARLRASGFPEVLDCNQEPAQAVDPADPMNVNLQLEEADLLQSNEIILQFLAFTR